MTGIIKGGVLLFMSLFTLSGSVVEAGAGILDIYFIDVGQGDATLIHQPGKCAILVDAGSFGKVGSVLDLLEKKGISKLDYAIVTHPHEDHFGGIKPVAEKVAISQLIDNGKESFKEIGFENYQGLKSAIPYSTMRAGDSFICGDLRVNALHPANDYDTGKNTNDSSLALHLKYHDFTLLLMGDVSGDGEQAMLETTEVPGASIIQLGHHGALDSTSAELLIRVEPELAIISVSEPNGIGAPADVVLDRLDEHKISVLRTDHEGTVHIGVQPDGTFTVIP